MVLLFMLLSFYSASVLTAQPYYTGYWLDEAVNSGAKCLDGSPPLFYFRPGTGDGVNKFYIHHEGGAACYSYDECLARSKTNLGSSRTGDDKPHMKMDNDYFSTDKEKNPLMYNWNSVFLRYCDGASFAGNNSTDINVNGETIYFRGYLVLQAIAEELLTKFDLGSASDVVISGCSAGGVATYFHVDEWASVLPRSKVVALPDSGYILEWNDDEIGKASWSWSEHNTSSGINQACVTVLGRECLFVQNLVPFIQTPMFMLQSIYDQWQVDNVLQTHDPDIVNAFGSTMQGNISLTFFNGQNGAFIDQCFHHCGNYDTMIINGETQATAFEKWYNSGTPPKGIEYNLERLYPCDSCCGDTSP